MCKYCRTSFNKKVELETEKILLKNSGLYICSDVESGYYLSDNEGSIIQKIKYCSKCGRELRKE